MSTIKVSDEFSRFLNRHLEGEVAVFGSTRYYIVDVSALWRVSRWHGFKSYADAMDTLFRRLTGCECWAITDEEADRIARRCTFPVTFQYTGVRSLRDLCIMKIAWHNPDLIPGFIEMNRCRSFPMPHRLDPPRVVSIRRKSLVRWDDFMDERGFARPSFRHMVLYYDYHTKQYEARTAFTSMHWSWWSRFMFRDDYLDVIIKELRTHHTASDQIVWPMRKEISKAVGALHQFFEEFAFTENKTTMFEVMLCPAHCARASRWQMGYPREGEFVYPDGASYSATWSTLMTAKTFIQMLQHGSDVLEVRNYACALAGYALMEALGSYLASRNGVVLHISIRRPLPYSRE